LNKIKDNMKYHTKIATFCWCILIISITSKASEIIQSKDTVFNICFKLKDDNSKPGDTVFLAFSPQHTEQKIGKKYYTVINEEGLAEFNIEQNYPYGYIAIVKENKSASYPFVYIVDNLFWENGDDILIHKAFDTSNSLSDLLSFVSFSGHNVEKYRTIYKIRKAYSLIQKQRRTNSRTTKGVTYDPLDVSYLDDKTSIKYLISVLDSCKENLSALVYNIYKTEIELLDKYYVYEKLNNISSLNNLDSVQKKALRSQIKALYLPIPTSKSMDDANAASYKFIKFYTSVFNCLAHLVPRYDQMSTLKLIKRHSKGKAREALLNNYLDMIGYSKENGKLYEYANKLVFSTYYKKELEQIERNFQFNVNSYSFKDINDRDIFLSQFNGKLVLIDIWFTGCGGCLTYRKDILSKIEEEFKNDENLEIVSVNFDKSKVQWLKSLSLNTYTSKYSYNLYTGGLKFSHPLFKNIGVVKAPTIILIDQRGNIIDFDSYRLHDLGLLREQILRYKK